MSRISKDLAEQIATKLTKGSYDAVKEIRTQYENTVLAAYQAQTPDEVVRVFNKFPDWFHTKACIRLNGHGFNWEWVNVSEQVICNTGNECNLKLTDAIASRITKAKHKYEKAQKAAKELRAETGQALINLRTFKNIREAIPEAGPFLPPPITNAIAINVNSLNKKLALQPKPEKELSQLEK